jgi:hypothetical protein
VKVKPSLSEKPEVEQSSPVIGTVSCNIEVTVDINAREYADMFNGHGEFLSPCTTGQVVVGLTL